MLNLLLALGQSFTITPLPIGPDALGGEVSSIANSGEACGTIHGVPGSAHRLYSVAVKWTAAGELVELGRVPGHSWGTSINSSGFVIGDTFVSYSVPYHPYLWGPQPWPATNLEGAGSIAINDTGDILLQQGIAGIFLPRAGGQVSFLALGSLMALDDTGAACGFHQDYAFRWYQGAFQDLLPAPGFTSSQAWDLVPGTVVGQSRTDLNDRATTWDLAGTPSLLPFLKPNGIYSGAVACNDQGWTIGYEWTDNPADPIYLPPQPYAVLWINGIPQELPLLSAWDVNNRGQIVGLDFSGLPVRLDPN
jgi:hypothetical protein